MEASSQRTVLIAGAGVGGLTLANSLAMRGITFRVIDPLQEPVRDSRAHGFGNRTLLALDKLGLVEPMLAAAQQPPPVLREYFGRTLVGKYDLGAVPRDPYPTMLAIFQQRVVRVLEAALIARGYQVEWSTRLVSFEMDDAGVAATIDRGGSKDTIRAGWIVGCEGSRSVVRATLGLDDPEAARPEARSFLRGLLCECDADWKLSRDIWWIWQSMDGFCGAIYNDFTDKWHIQALDLEGYEPTLERVELLLRRRSGISGVRLTNAAWVHWGSFSKHAATHFIKGRAALVGDAAHTFSSVAGQGLHFAIEDAVNLGWKLALAVQGAASASLLETYESERRERYENALERTRWTERFLTLPAWAAKTFWASLYFIRAQVPFYFRNRHQAGRAAEDDVSRKSTLAAGFHANDAQNSRWHARAGRIVPHRRQVEACQLPLSAGDADWLRCPLLTRGHAPLGQCKQLGGRSGKANPSSTVGQQG